ncbi:macro domain-containing protein [Bacillus safensis]|uniref:macro domain-containing protein n=1 Tax=Bacillus TaxID=1386 RepID=UPI0006FC04F2|nr:MULTISPECIES: macro domain-containing protein [Bacillus]KRE20122.1 Appr-1-p processing protein [Bacillus sp. Root920]MCY7508212.1 macro domain-containing protein [Bacillus safensis]MCY7515151.1 macro domain-containing protein [Bacillus safensis]MED4708740.1 macro domain-containing protein [Bacillus safensis]
MIKTVNGNILEASEDIICHQVNCKGVMGAGLAKQIKSKYPNVFKDYKQLCTEQGDDLLSSVQLITTKDGKTIANLFAQAGYGRTRKQTDYDALRSCFQHLKDTVTQSPEEKKQTSIAIPYGIGCGLAGGDWTIVEEMIEEVLGDCEVTVYRFR